MSIGMRILFWFLLFSVSSAAQTLSTNQVNEIVQRSVSNTNQDWDAAPKYDYTERDNIVKHGKKTIKTYRVSMIDGSPYYKLIAVNDQPLSPGQAAEEERKLQRETASRNAESPAARRERIASYQKGRRQDHWLLSEMVKAFDYKLAGQDTIDGRRCFVLDATPRPAYRPPNRDTQVLKGMRGKMWVDAQQYQWVKVHAEVFRPVSFGLFIARVFPGTEFNLENAPAQGNLWLPSHFSTDVHARVLVFPLRSSDDETYSNYRLAQ